MIIKDIDRFAELASIGAGHAVTAFSQLTGHTITMDSPRLRIPDVAQPETSEGEGGWSSGVLFEFDGCIDALVGILFRPAMCDAVVHKLVGGSDQYHSPEIAESVLMEVGNILASHVASAIADTLSARLLPSIPTIEMENAGKMLEEWAEARIGSRAPRIECQFTDDEGQLGGLVVLIPNFPND